jgi:trans-AT polyketide synthase/acyltransferase/oxidoreductase domain-containing protein
MPSSQALGVAGPVGGLWAEWDAMEGARYWTGLPAQVAFSTEAIALRLRDLRTPCYVVQVGERLGLASGGAITDSSNGSGSLPLLASAHPLPPERLGDPGFTRTHGVRLAYMTGAMANGIAGETLVLALGRAGLLASFGAAGLAPARIEAAVRRIQVALPEGPYACNLIHSPNEEALERATVECYLRCGVRTVEASAYLALTPHLVRYRLAGLRLGPDGAVQACHRVIAKVSRREVATRFLTPAPEGMVRDLLAAGWISDEQARLAERVPLCDDLTVEADSGGHTDNRPLVCLLPSLLALRDELQARYRYAVPVRIGAAGGIGTPHAALAAFSLGAAYVVTGSINQACLESGTSPQVRALLAQAAATDVRMAPAADMFELGAQVQVLSRGTLFPPRAQRLAALYRTYETLAAIPPAERTVLERQIFRRDLAEVWAETLAFFQDRDPEQLARAVAQPKRALALLFRWYLGLSSRWAMTGEAGRETDYQIWCGPAMGAFNDWVRGSALEDPACRRVVPVAEQIMTGAAYLARIQELRRQGIGVAVEHVRYVPMLGTQAQGAGDADDA